MRKFLLLGCSFLVASASAFGASGALRGVWAKAPSLVRTSAFMNPALSYGAMRTYQSSARLFASDPIKFLPAPVASKLSASDLEAIRKVVAEELTRQTSSAERVNEEVLAAFAEQGLSPEEAKARLSAMDSDVDGYRKRRLLPYGVGLVGALSFVPASVALVYYEPFYSWFFETFPNLKTHSWDDAEPFLQSVLVGQTGIAVAGACAAALGYNRWSRRVVSAATSLVNTKYGLNKQLADAYVRTNNMFKKEG